MKFLYQFQELKEINARVNDLDKILIQNNKIEQQDHVLRSLHTQLLALKNVVSGLPSKWNKWLRQIQKSLGKLNERKRKCKIFIVFADDSPKGSSEEGSFGKYEFHLKNHLFIFTINDIKSTFFRKSNFE